MAEDVVAKMKKNHTRFKKGLDYPFRWSNQAKFHRNSLYAEEFFKEGSRTFVRPLTQEEKNKFDKLTKGNK